MLQVFPFLFYKFLLAFIYLFPNILTNEVPWSQSPYHLTYLASLESHIYNRIVSNRSSFLTTLDSTIQSKILSLVEDYEESSKHVYKSQDQIQYNANPNWKFNWSPEPSYTDGVQNFHNIIGSPILTLRMVERYIKLIQDIVPWLPSSNPLRSLILKEQRKYEFPSLIHKVEILNSIIRLREVYQLNINDFVDTEPALKPYQIYEIGKTAMHAKYYTEAMDWFSMAHEITINDEDSKLNLTNILKLMEAVALMHDEDLTNPRHPSKYKYTHFLFNESKMETQKERFVENVLKFAHTPINLTEAELETRFDLICNGYNFQSEIEKSHLYCWYESNVDFAWLLGPLKMELLDPVINLVHVYDFIGNKAINEILKIALPQVRSSQMQNMTDQPFSYSFAQQDRVSSGTFLDDQKYPILEKLSRSYEKLTSLVVVNEEREFRKDYPPPWNRIYASPPYQLNAYAFGGYFSPHVDTINIKKNPVVDKYAGERLATIIAYLNDVEEGGLTAFTDIGVAALPKKGSVLMWYTLRRNGKVYCRSVHGGCPILSGSKVILNKWIHEHENFQKRKCSLNKFE